MEQQYRNYLALWKAGLETGNKGEKIPQVSKHVRRFLRDKYGDKCSKCGWAQRNQYNHIIHLTVEHRDGNWQNTVEENLDLLCPNCHTLTSTYGILNKGHGRTYRHKGP